MSKLFFAIAIVCLAGLALADSCQDAIQISYANSVQLPDFSKNLNVAPAAIRFQTFKDAFNFTGNFTKPYFYVVAGDQYYIGKKVASIGQIYYQTNNPSDSLLSAYFAQSPNSSVIYTCPSTGRRVEIFIKTMLNASIKMNDSKTLEGDFLQFTLLDPLFVNEDLASNEMIVAISKVSEQIAPGSVFLNSVDGYHLIGSPYTDRYRYYYPRISFYGCCTLSCIGQKDLYSPNICTSTLYNATDYCSDDSTVVDYSCSTASICAPKISPCEFGCVNGACVKENPETCTDSDGLNENTLGIVKGKDSKGKSFEFQDACVSGKLSEYYCSISGTPQTKSFDCNCVNGVCAKTTATPTATASIAPNTQQSQTNFVLIGVITLLAGLGVYYFMRAKPPQAKPPVRMPPQPANAGKPYHYKPR